jgi:ER lumen protein retaining receptor
MMVGISLKSQELYALVFATRYLDIFWNFTSVYLTVMKLIFLGTSFAIIYLIRYKYKFSYDREHDTFRVAFLIAPCALLALLINQEFTVFEVIRTGTLVTN